METINTEKYGKINVVYTDNMAQVDGVPVIYDLIHSYNGYEVDVIDHDEYGYFVDERISVWFIPCNTDGFYVGIHEWETYEQ